MCLSGQSAAQQHAERVRQLTATHAAQLVTVQRSHDMARREVELYNTEEHEEQSDGGLFAIHVEFEEAFCVGLSFIRVVPCQERLKGEKLSASINGSGQL